MDGNAAVVDELSTDGRNLRRQKNRAAAVEALLDLQRSGNLRPSALEIAKRAGLSARSLFRYFDDVDDLSRAAIERQLQLAEPLLPIGAKPEDPLELRIAALAKQRLRLYDAIAPAATVSRLQAPFQPLLAERIRKTRLFLRMQILELFASELFASELFASELFASELGASELGASELGASELNTAALSAIDALCSFETFVLLREDQGLTDVRLRAVLVHALHKLLATGPEH